MNVRRFPWRNRGEFLQGRAAIAASERKFLWDKGAAAGFSDLTPESSVPASI